jgi:hypothetical protein
VSTSTRVELVTESSALHFKHGQDLGLTAKELSGDCFNRLYMIRPRSRRYHKDSALVAFSQSFKTFDYEHQFNYWFEKNEDHMYIFFLKVLPEPYNFLVIYISNNQSYILNMV